MRKQMYKKNEETPAGCVNLILPEKIANAFEKLNPKTDYDISHLCMMLDSKVFGAISEFLADPFQEQNTLYDLLFMFLDLGKGNLDTYYDDDLHGFFLRIREIISARVSYIEKEKGGSNE
jgi:hypothetical protein